MRTHRRGLEPKTERAERADLQVRTPKLSAKSPRDQSAPHCVRPSGFLLSRKESDMTQEAKSIVDKSDIDSWKYSEKAMSWYGWASPVGLSVFILSSVASTALVIHVLHVVGVVR
jgi:hypothetical protein